MRPRKIGRMFIPAHFIYPNLTDEMRALMAQTIVVECVYHWDSQCFEYVVICPKLDYVPEGEIIPKYRAIFTRNPPMDQLVIKFERENT